VATWTEQLTLAGNPAGFIAVTHDGRRLYAGSGTGVVRVYSLLLEDTVTLAHERLTRWWRPEECLIYLRTEECPPAPERLAANE
jgi:hypothetical protein